MRRMPIEPEEPAATAIGPGVIESAEEKKDKDRFSSFAQSHYPRRAAEQEKKEWMQQKLSHKLEGFEAHAGSMGPRTGSLTSSSGARTPNSDEEVVGSKAYA